MGLICLPNLFNFIAQQFVINKNDLKTDVAK